MPSISNDGKRLKILLAEDSEDNVLIMRLYLKNYPCDIDVAEDGENAVRLFRANTYGLVLMDIQMPGMDGYQATECIREVERERGQAPVPVIAVTAHASDEIRRRVLDSGADGYITKPVPKARLLEAIRSVVEEGGRPGF
ncbi:MAG: response regulator [Desulfovibrionaceae bacterium]